MRPRTSRRDTICAVVLLGAGLLALAIGLSLDLGSPRRIGPGAFPALVGAGLLLTGLAMLAFGR